MTSPKTYIVNAQATETDTLDFTPYVETLPDIIQTGNMALTISVVSTWGSGKIFVLEYLKS
ncbi:MAG: hypothetical protein Q8L41_07870 [Anaerolineales bacterium]|nr:hypothetical protein [Anaerolineales bacterium]